jgi:AraC-like DNA-binding protein
MTQTTLATIPRLLNQVLSIYGVEPAPVFEQAGISLTDINTRDARIAMNKMSALWQCCVNATNNEELGLVAASLFQPTYLKGIGLAWMASANLEEGLHRFVKNSQLVNTAMQIELVEQGDELIIKYQTSLPPEIRVKTHRCAIELGIGFFLKMFRLAAGKTIPATGVYFTFSTKQGMSAYQDYFQCPVHSNHDFNAISFSKSLLKELLPTHDPELVELNEMVVQKYISSIDNGLTSKKVISVINKLLPSGCPTEEIVAFTLHMSKRTLQRKLSAEDNSFVYLLTSVRMALAKTQLTLDNLSVTEIAYQLGYSSPSTFARAFKKQNQLSPLEYRVNTVNK